jgi:hypothetical protein
MERELLTALDDLARLLERGRKPSAKIGLDRDMGSDPACA